jgi:antitoxin component of MazEF toxin-antitoxin module
MSEVRRISKSGNSKVISLPSKCLRAAKLRLGDVVLIDVVNDTLVLSRAVSSRQLFEERHADATKTRD